MDLRASPGERPAWAPCEMLGGLAAIGVLPKRPSLLWHGAPAEGLAPAAAYTDGSVGDPIDPLLARAAWAVILADGQVTVVSVTGGFAGQQTAPCAEHAAAMWVAEGSGGSVPIFSDCEHMCLGVDSCGVGRQLLLDGSNKDTWARLLAPLPRMGGSGPPKRHWRRL